MTAPRPLSKEDLVVFGVVFEEYDAAIDPRIYFDYGKRIKDNGDLLQVDVDKWKEFNEALAANRNELYVQLERLREVAGEVVGNMTLGHTKEASMPSTLSRIEDLRNALFETRDMGHESIKRLAAQLEAFKDEGTIERLFEAVVWTCTVHRAVNSTIDHHYDSAEKLDDILEELYLPLGLCPETGRKLS